MWTELDFWKCLHCKVQYNTEVTKITLKKLIQALEDITMEADKMAQIDLCAATAKMFLITRLF